MIGPCKQALYMYPSIQNGWSNAQMLGVYSWGNPWSLVLLPPWQTIRTRTWRVPRTLISVLGLWENSVHIRQPFGSLWPESDTEYSKPSWLLLEQQHLFPAHWLLNATCQLLTPGMIPWHDSYIQTHYIASEPALAALAWGGVGEAEYQSP